MRKNKNIFSFLIVLAVMVSSVYAQNFDTIQIRTTKVSGNVYMLTGSGGNIGVLTGNDGNILIDDQFAQLSEKISKAVSAINTNPVKFIINTHFHYDHTDGNKALGNSAIIVAHDNVRKRLSSDQFVGSNRQEQKALDYNGLPKITFAESVSFNMNGEVIEVYHVKNAHTDGDAIIYFKNANVVHTGDVFVRYGLPFIDETNGGTVDGMIAGVSDLLKKINDDVKIIPGHGGLATKTDLEEYLSMLQTVRDRVAEGIRTGKTIDEIIASDPAKEYRAGVGKADFIKTVYYSLKK